MKIEEFSNLFLRGKKFNLERSRNTIEFLRFIFIYNSSWISDVRTEIEVNLSTWGLNILLQFYVFKVILRINQNEKRRYKEQHV